MFIRDRIQALRRVRASDLRPHPLNWRLHPPAQQNALRAVLAEVGYVDALLVRELTDGSLELLDGHLRAETTPDVEVPVLVVDLSDAEAAKVLATFDPLSALAQPDPGPLGELLSQVETACPALHELLDDLAAQAGRPPAIAEASTEPPAECSIPEAYQIVVECRDEADQQELFERLSQEGRRCRVLTL